MAANPPSANKPARPDISNAEVEALLDKNRAAPAPGVPQPFDLAADDRIVRGRMPTLDRLNERWVTEFQRKLGQIFIFEPFPLEIKQCGAPKAFASGSGSAIRGWLIRGRAGGGAVLLLHGVGANRTSMVGRALFLHAAGYTILLVGHNPQLSNLIEHLAGAQGLSTGELSALDLDPDQRAREVGRFRQEE